MRHNLNKKLAHGGPSDPLREYLRKRELRASHVRRYIQEAILARDGHFDAENLVDDLRARHVKASRATVYRTLPILREAGIIRSTVHSGERSCYEVAAHRAHHDHLVCTDCGRVVEFQCRTFETLQGRVAHRHGFTLTGHSHELFGICADCRRKRGKGT